MKHDINARWEQHKKDGGKLTLEEFSKRKPKAKRFRKPRDRFDAADISRKERAKIALEIFEDLPDGAFLAAAHETFGIDPEDFIDD